MATLINIAKNKPGMLHKLAGALKRLGHAINNLFVPEEVEVTFTKVGNSIKYSYTKVGHHKHLA